MSSEVRPFAEMILQASQRVLATRRPHNMSLRERLDSLDRSGLPEIWKRKTDVPSAFNRIAASISAIRTLQVPD